MNAFRRTLLAASFMAGALPGLGAAGEPPRPAPVPRPPEAGAQVRQADLQRQIEEARRNLERASVEVARLSAEMGRNSIYRIEGLSQQRALFGVDVRTNDKNDGAQVVRVSPGGAAEEAGLKVGDIITSIGGHDLIKEEDSGRALVDRMGQMEPNQKVQLGVLRDGKEMNFEVTPRPAPVRSAQQWSRLLAEARANQQQSGRFTTVVPAPVLAAGSTTTNERFRDTEFATLSEKLGGYFGVKSGVLVVRAGANSAFKLEDGDVLLAVDGREVTSAQQAGRILRSYSDGEKLKLRLQRDRKVHELEITMPGAVAESRGARTIQRRD